MTILHIVASAELIKLFTMMAEMSSIENASWRWRTTNFYNGELLHKPSSFSLGQWPYSFIHHGSWLPHRFAVRSSIPKTLQNI